MSISEKLITIAENQQRVYEQGKVDGNLVLLATQVQFGNLNLFGKPEVELYLPNATSLEYLCRVFVKNVTVEHLTITTDGQPLTQCYGILHAGGHGDDTMKRVTINADLSASKQHYYMFHACRALEVVDGTPIDFTSCVETSNIFYSCNVLREVRFAPGTLSVDLNMLWSPLLSAETIQSVIDGLADLTGATAHKLTFANAVGTALTEAQKAAITAKNWTLVY